MSEPPAGSELSPDEGTALARYAADAVQATLSGREPDGRPPEPARLRALGASFVTVESRGTLRGCIGSLVAVRPLYLDVIRNARRALADPRLLPVTGAEWPVLDVAVSVLSPLRPLPVTGRADLIAALRPGVDGLALQAGGRRATFLPVVWRKLADPERFVTALLVKGGWPARGWPDGAAASRYTTAEFVDRAPRAPLPPAG
jgi:AmmeMemoRadiSam system protein A